VIKFNDLSEGRRWDKMSVKIFVGDCRQVLQTRAPESVQCCITSPPY